MFHSGFVASVLVLLVDFYVVFTILCGCFRTRVFARLRGRTSCVSCSVGDRNTSCVSGFGTSGGEVALVSRGKAILTSASTGTGKLRGRTRQDRVGRTRSGKGKGDSECSGALVRGALCCTRGLSGNAVLHMSAARGSIMIVLLKLLCPVVMIVMVTLVLSLMLSDELSGGVVGPVGRVSLRGPTRGVACRRLAPLLGGVSTRGGAVSGRLGRTGRERRRFGLVARGVDRKLLIVSGSTGILSFGSTTLHLLRVSSMADNDMLAFGEDGNFEAIMRGTLTKREYRGSVCVSSGACDMVTGPMCMGDGVVNTMVMVLSVARDTGERRLEQRFASGMSRRLGAPLATVSKFTRVVVRNNAPRGAIISFSAAVCGTTKELVALIDSVVGVSRLSRNTIVIRRRGISLRRLSGRVVAQLGSITRGGGVALGLVNSSTFIINTGGVVSRVVCGLYSGTVGCGGRGKVMSIVVGAVRGGIGIAIHSANVNVPLTSRGEIFREFCEISGDRSGRVNNANLNLSVMGRNTTCRGTRVSLRDIRSGNADVAVSFTGTVGWRRKLVGRVVPSGAIGEVASVLGMVGYGGCLTERVVDQEAVFGVSCKGESCDGSGLLRSGCCRGCGKCDSICAFAMPLIFLFTISYHVALSCRYSYYILPVISVVGYAWVWCIRLDAFRGGFFNYFVGFVGVS